MALILEITKADGTITRTPLQSQTTKVGAWPGGKVRVIDSATGKSPPDITATKVGDSLVVDGLPEGKKVEVTKFYTDCSPETPCSVVIDPADGGQAVPITQTSQPVAALPDNQALMYGPTSDTAAAAPAAAASSGVPTGALIGGVALLGVAAAASGGGGGGSSTPPAPPSPPPDTTAPNAPAIANVAGDNVVNAAEAAAGVAVSGTAEAGSTVEVTWGSTTKTATADGSGNWSVNFASGEVPTDVNTTISATARDAAGNTSVAGTVAVAIDTDAPSAPSAIAGPDGAVSGMAEANSTVRLGAAETTADGSGNYQFAAGTLASGATASVTATDAAGNTSTATNVTAGTYLIGTAGDDIIVAGATSFVDGGAGNDVLIGGGGGSVRNYQFEYWNTSGGGFEADGGGDYAVFGAAAKNGWIIGSTLDSITVGPDGATLTQYTGGPMELFANDVPWASAGWSDDTGGGGLYHWETVFDATSGGSSISQSIFTIADESYTLSVQVSKDDGDSSLTVHWGGVEIARYDGVTHEWLVDDTHSKPESTDISDSRQTWTWTVTGAPGADATQLEFRAYEVNDGSDGMGIGMRIDRITLDPVAADGDGTIVGGAGNDLIFGQGGNDTIYGGAFGTDSTTTDDGADTFVYSMRASNGNDVIKDFQVGTDRIFLVDALDTYTDDSWLPGAVNSETTTTNADDNLTFADFLKAGSPTQYLTVTADDNGWLKLGFFGQDNTGAATDLGSVVLEGVNAADYSGVQSLFTGPNAILSATMDGFHTGLQVV